MYIYKRKNVKQKQIGTLIEVENDLTKMQM
jgi:hypothetical protein